MFTVFSWLRWKNFLIESSAFFLLIFSSFFITLPATVSADNLIEMTLAGLEESAVLRVPRTYLVSKANLRGGLQTVVELEARLLEVSKSETESEQSEKFKLIPCSRITAPFCKAKGLEKIFITLKPRKYRAASTMWRTYYEKNFVLKQRTEYGLDSYSFRKAKPGEKLVLYGRDVFRPQEMEHDDPAVLNCLRGNESKIGCKAIADMQPHLFVNYTFARKHLQKWKGVHEVVGSLIESFFAAVNNGNDSR